MSTQTAFDFHGIIVTDCLGRTRTPDKVYADGSYNCPFCSYAVAPGASCGNPACFSRPGFPPETARRWLAEADARQAAEEARRQAHAADMARARLAAERRRQAHAAAVAEAQARGCCPHCAVDRYGRVKFIKHRKTCPLERA